jgi:agmatinase
MTDNPLFQSPDASSEANRALEKEARLPLTGWQQEVSQGLEFGLEAAASIRDRSIPTFSRGELPHYAGINTFLKAPYLEDVRDRRCASRFRHHLSTRYTLWTARYSADLGTLHAL